MNLEVPEGWNTSRLGDILVEKRVRARDTDGGEALPVLSLTKRFGLIRQDRRFDHRVARADVSDYKVVEPGWIAYNPMVLWEGAIHALLNEEPGLVSPVYAIWKAEGADWMFLHYMLRTPALLGEFLRLASGVVKRRRTVKKDQFLSIEVALPPLAEQRAIAHVLHTVQRAKDQAEQVLQAKLKLKDALREHLLAGEISASVPLSKNSDAEGEPEPNEWQLISCDEICRQITVGVVIRPADYYRPEGIPAFRSFNIEEDRLVPRDLVFFDPEAHRTALSKSRLSAGDVLIVRTGRPGTSCVVPEEFNDSNCIDLVIARPDERLVSSEFLSRYFNSRAAQNQVQQQKVGLAQKHLNVGAVKRMLVNLPPRQKQDEIVRVLSAIDLNMTAEEKWLVALKELFEALLHELMAGKTRVKNLQRVA